MGISTAKSDRYVYWCGKWILGVTTLDNGGMEIDQKNKCVYKII